MSAKITLMKCGGCGQTCFVLSGSDRVGEELAAAGVDTDKIIDDIYHNPEVYDKCWGCRVKAP
jgi:hypothetical protein